MITIAATARPRFAVLARGAALAVAACVGAAFSIGISGAAAGVATQSFSPVADGYVSAANPDGTHGPEVDLRVQGSPLRTSYLRFAVSGLAGSVSRATLRVYSTSPHPTGFDVRAVASQTWSENALTYNNAPAADSTVTSSSGGFAAYSWVSVDVTALVRGNGTYSFALTSTSATTMWLAAREYGASYKPQLDVEVASGTTTTAPPAPTTVPPATTTVPPVTTTVATTTTVPATTTTTPVGAGKRVYYVSATGSDSSSGLSPAAAWRTVAKVNATSLAPGDTVLFAGGQTFADTYLSPRTSGIAGAPLVFGSYGTGRANLRQGIWFASRSYLTFSNLKVDSGAYANAGNLNGIAASGSGTGSRYVTVQDCVFLNVRIAIHPSNANDAFWTVADNLVQYTRDTAILIEGGHDQLYARNTILDSGKDASIPYGKHGVYDKGPSNTFVDNVIRRSSGGGISLRFHNSRVERNTISEVVDGIAWFQNETVAGTTTIAYNKVSGTTGAALYISPSDAGFPTVESFVVDGNTFAPASGVGIDLQKTAGAVTLANNVVTGGSTALSAVAPGKGYREHHNLYWRATGTASLRWNGAAYALAGYKTASGQGAADRVDDPKLGTGFAPALGSPVVDAGTAAVDATLAFSALCDGAAYHFCGLAPDLGAVESR